MSVTDPSTPKLYLVDGSSFIYRAYYALPRLTNSAGEPTGAIYGVTAMLRKLLEEADCTHVAVVFDPPGKTVRHEWYADYKVNRMAMPDILKQQIEGIFDIVDAMGLPRVQVNGHEADDVIATYVREAKKLDWSVVVVTGDKDLCQLVDDRVVIWDPQRERLLDRDGVFTKYGVWPEQIIDYLSLIGDNSDDIPGIPKVGPKTAAKWLAAYQNLDHIIASADEIKGKVGENLRAHLDQLPLAKRLVTAIDDLDLPTPSEELLHAKADVPALADCYRRFGFHTWLKDLDEIAGDDIEGRHPLVGQARLITDTDKLADWWKACRQAGTVAIDLETTSLSVIDAEIVGVAMAIEGEPPVYVPVGHLACGQNLPLERLRAEINTLLEETSILWIAHNWKYDGSVLRQHGFSWPARFADTLLMSYVLNPTQTRHDLDRLALSHLALSMTAYDDVTNQGMTPFAEVDVDKAARYAGEDAYAALGLYRHFTEKLEEQPSLTPILESIEWPLIPVLSAMERHGVLIDQDELKAQSASLASRMQRIEEEVLVIAGEPFNLASPKQLQVILFEKLQLPIVKKTKSGQPSTDLDVLAKLGEQHVLPRLILEHRHLAKLKSTYTDRLPEACHPHTRRVHCQYHQAVTSTGRLSSSNPNLQNIPTRTEEGRMIRQAFIAPPGFTLIAADYSQIELRLVAHYAQDPSLLKAFAEGRDVHAATAAELFDVSIDDVDREQRRMAKIVNFGLLYGMSVFGLARNLGIERKAAQAIFDRYFERYPGVHNYIETTKEKAREQGYVETLCGRRLWLPHINDRNALERQAAERAAINAPLQGSAADIIKKAMIAIHRVSLEEAWPCHMIMQVHDELVFEVEEEHAERLMPRIAELMSQAMVLSVPLVVDMNSALNWEQAH